MRTALTIAGSDPGGGAGVQADLKTFAAHRVYGLSAITALTVQDSRAVSTVNAVEPALVAAQIDAVVSDFGADATKIGMLVNAALVHVVADAVARHHLRNVVLDPVRRASAGPALLDDAGLRGMIEKLLPLATVITPNASEAAELTGQPVTSLEEQKRAASALLSRGARAVVVKGGDLPGRDATDVFYDGDSFIELRADRLESRHTHGTGCTFSAAIAAHLALGADLATAVREAKRYVSAAIAQAPELGHGRGPLQHFPMGHGDDRMKQ
jgi:hydroxymethylpyrimidine/phosphomethylpyrimidine kinase